MLSSWNSHGTGTLPQTARQHGGAGPDGSRCARARMPAGHRYMTRRRDTTYKSQTHRRPPMARRRARPKTRWPPPRRWCPLSAPADARSPRAATSLPGRCCGPRRRSCIALRHGRARTAAGAAIPCCLLPAAHRHARMCSPRWPCWSTARRSVAGAVAAAQSASAAQSVAGMRGGASTRLSAVTAGGCAQVSTSLAPSASATLAANDGRTRRVPPLPVVCNDAYGACTLPHRHCLPPARPRALHGAPSALPAPARRALRENGAALGAGGRGRESGWGSAHTGRAGQAADDRRT